MPECDRCDRFFSKPHALQQHLENSVFHNMCWECGIDFPTWTRLKEHWVQSRRHPYCQDCNCHFPDDDELVNHLYSDHNFTVCRPCRRVFKTDAARKKHYRETPQHHYCAECDRLFIAESNLRAHLNSATHRPKDVVCPFRCGSKFVSRSALVLHLESGVCTSGVDRDTVNCYVRQLDTDNIITDPSRMITGPNSTPNQSVRYIATRASWNGSAYECYLCHNTYRTLRSLNQHLDSPRHQDQIYLCCGPSCGQRFTVLSALVQHIESEKCGVHRFRAVQNAMDSLLGQMGRLTMG